MHILVSNDDGYRAPGMHALAAALRRVAKVTVVAPDRDRSGSSNSLTLDDPLRVTEIGPGLYQVNGTPTDCVHLAITGLLNPEPDMVISGINAGANMGDDVIYSGTVAAAMEGRSLGLPAIALSLASPTPVNFEAASQVALLLLERLQADPLPADTILNVNVPDVPWAQIAGFDATRLGQRHRSASIIRAQDSRSRPIYWIGPAGTEQDAGPGTDFYAVRNNVVSITPLQIDLTRYQALDQVAGWVKGLR